MEVAHSYCYKLLASDSLNRILVLFIIIYHMQSFVGADLAYCLIFHKTRLMTVQNCSTPWTRYIYIPVYHTWSWWTVLPGLHYLPL